MELGSRAVATHYAGLEKALGHDSVKPVSERPFLDEDVKSQAP